jgi:Zn-dependent protease
VPVREHQVSIATIRSDRQNQQVRAQGAGAGMNENVSLGRIAGIHVGFNWSLLVVAALIAWSLATSFLPSATPGQTSAAYWTAGVISAFVFLASLLAHELAHSIVAMRRGVKVEGITLWLFGGVSRFSSDTNSPGTQALFTFVGPLTSLVLGAIFYVISIAIGNGPHPPLCRGLATSTSRSAYSTWSPPFRWTEAGFCSR